MDAADHHRHRAEQVFAVAQAAFRIADALGAPLGDLVRWMRD
jgi:hypothetical protein